ncbi:DUF2075 domain-containing protein [Acidianus sp. HS-5]|uniref:DUF2075 domain-containing protein n=1 Tax=Acidianus sp. HS-5 TaxID=2886040 RepID=UPI001F2DB4B9|nr:DUF2075 domain-containing protein [Acidianus sp. HS-5]BDC18723.1 ATP-binding protein [Acidianus sp. HS-5]
MIRYLYANATDKFSRDVSSGDYVEILKHNFYLEFGYKPSQSEINSWIGSSKALLSLVKGLSNIYIVAELSLPYSSSRVDYVIFGKKRDGKEAAIIIEMKGWTDAKQSFSDDYVRVNIGQGWEDVLHPSIQVKGYVEYLKDILSFARQNDMKGVSYTYNARIDYLYDSRFSKILNQYQLFDINTRDRLRNLISQINYGSGEEVFNKFITSKIAPQKGLIEELEKVLKSKNLTLFIDRFTLIDDQIAVYDKVLSLLKEGKKAVIIIEGGPGTGKSVIALKLMAEVMKQGYTVFHATGSKAFTTTLRKIVDKNSLFRYFNSFSTDAEKGTDLFDVLIADEAHRIRERSNTRFSKGSSYPQIEELIRVARVGVFFLDPYQIVRPEEVGNSKLIEYTAKKYNAEVYKITLKTQFRSSGSQEYIKWVDNLLGIENNEVEYYTESFGVEFKIFDDPESLRQEIIAKNKQKPNSARLVAGFCWKWNDPNLDGTLPQDIVINYDDGKIFKATWEAKDIGKKLAEGVPPAPLWAYDPAGVTQVGSIYTIQGFEFDYVGVIWCKDLIYNWEKGEWEAHQENSADPAINRKKPKDVLDKLKNTYRVLLTRGRKGVYVYFLDGGTREFVESRIRKDKI